MKKGTSGNLSQPVRRFLFNDVTVADFGLYTDATTTFKNLILKKLGYTLTSFASGSNITVTRQCTDAGQLKVVSVDFDTDCPCVECGFDYGINVMIRHMLPGYHNDMTDRQKPYSGNISNINCVSGAIDSTQIQTMRDDIINQINDDIGYMNPLAGANVIAGRVFKLTGFVAGMGCVINGHVYNGQVLLATLITAINATTHAYAFADPTTPLTVMWLIMNDTPTTSVITSGMSVYNKGIGIISKDEKWDFFVEVQPLDATGTVTTIQASQFPFLTSDDVFRIFSGGAAPHGQFATQTYITQPIDGAEYCKYVIEVEDFINDLTGASHFEFYVGTIELYIRNVTANISTNIWDATNGMWESIADNGAFVADTSLNTLLMTTWQA